MMEDYHGLDGELRLTGDDAEMKLFEESLANMNSFFEPRSDADARPLILLFVGTVEVHSELPT